jgi:hypothetical protein
MSNKYSKAKSECKPQARLNRAVVKGRLAVLEKSQVDLAAHLQISACYLSEMLAGTRLGAKHFPKIASYLGVSEAEILIQRT